MERQRNREEESEGASGSLPSDDEGGNPPSQKRGRFQNSNSAPRDTTDSGDQDGGRSRGSSSASSGGLPDDHNFINYGPRTFLLQPYRHNDKLAVEYFNQGRNRSSVAAKKICESGQNGDYQWKGGKAAEFPLDKFIEWLNGGSKCIVESSVGAEGCDEAQLVVIFGTATFYNLLANWNDSKSDGGPDEGMETICGKICREGPKVITTFSKGVIGNVPLQRGFQSSVELENVKLPCISGLVIPKVAAGVGTKTFILSLEDNEKLDDLNQDISLEKCKEILGITKEIEGRLKGIVFFQLNKDEYQKRYRTVPIVRVVHTYLKANRHVAMAGGIHLEVLHSGTNDGTLMACGFLVFGDDDRVRVNCAALMEKGMSKGNVNKLEKLKANLLTTENPGEEVSSFAIMCPCQHRGYRMHRSYGVETGYFNKILPETPVVGAFDFGEFYREILDGNGKGMKRSVPEVIHDIHVSAFFVVSYAHPKY